MKRDSLAKKDVVDDKPEIHRQQHKAKFDQHPLTLRDVVLRVNRAHTGSMIKNFWREMKFRSMSVMVLAFTCAFDNVILLYEASLIFGFEVRPIQIQASTFDNEE